MEPQAGASTYRLGFGHILRLIGPAIIAVGVVWLVLAALGANGVLRGLAGLLTVVVVFGGLVLVARPPRILRLTADGYRISWVRGTGDPVAAWSQVEAVGTQRVGDAVSLVFELSNGRTSSLPLTLLGPRNAEAQREVHERLNAANGYRKLG